MKSNNLHRIAVIWTVFFVVYATPVLASKPSHTGYPRLMQGPMVGAVGPTEVKIWIRTSGEFPVTIQYAEGPDFVPYSETSPVTAIRSSNSPVWSASTFVQPNSCG